ncbi:MAG: hypothetical protein HFJ29_08645 [Clostridia bacterium]|nr:hypothetical protein [Clostridia bacterium]
MKKLLILSLAFLIIISAFYYSVYATNTKSIVDKFDYLEYESQHMFEHENAEIQNKYNTYALVIIILLLIINSIIFCILAEKNKKILPTYFILVLITLLLYIVCSIYIRDKYPSNLAIIPINQYIIISLVSISTLLGLFIRTNKTRIIISSIPSIVMMLFVILGAFISFLDIKYLLEDILTALNYLLLIELPTQMILLPIYLRGRLIKDG